MSFEPILPAHIDSTMLSTFRSCERKFYNEFVRGMRPTKKSQDLHAGGVFAHTLEHIYKRAHAGVPILDVMAEAELLFHHNWGDFPLDPLSPKTPDRVWAALEGYVSHYGLLSDKIQPYRLNGEPTFEYSFAVPLDAPTWPRHPVSGDPFLFVGRFDLLGEYNGLPIIRDEKTTKYGGTNWAKQWDMRGQFLGYCKACQLQGIKATTVCIRGVVIQKTQIQQLEAIRPYNQGLIDRWYEQTRLDLIRICERWAGGWWNYDFAEACSSYGGCMFIELCESDSTGWESNFTESRWNPLDLNPVDPTFKPEPFTIGAAT